MKSLVSIIAIFIIVSFPFALPAKHISEKNREGLQNILISHHPSFADLSYEPVFHNFSNQYEGVILNTTFEIWNSGCCGLTYAIIEECNWVNVSPIYGHSYGEKDLITITVDTTGLPRGKHDCILYLDTSASDAEFLVRVTIIEPPNHPPETPELSGPNTGLYGEIQTFTARSSDSDGDQVWYKWDFGDENITEWMGPYEHTVDCRVNHTFCEEGIYQVKVQAKDEHDDLSTWSDPLTIKMPKQKVIVHYFIHLVQWFLNIHT